MSNQTPQTDGLASPEVAKLLMSAELKSSREKAATVSEATAAAIVQLAARTTLYYNTLVNQCRLEPFVAGQLAGKFQAELMAANLEG